MYKTLMLALVLLASATWLQAQAYPQSAPTQSAEATSDQTAVQGCLQESKGNYALTADDGTVYQLTGKTAELKEHVGHEVQITGEISNSTQPGTTSAATAGMTHQATLEVKSMKHISKTCKSVAK